MTYIKIRMVMNIIILIVLKNKNYFTFCIYLDIKLRFYSPINTILKNKINNISGINNLNLNTYVENKIDEQPQAV